MTLQREERVSAIRGFPSKTSHTLSALSGGAFVVLIVVAFLLDLSHPTFNDDPAKFASFYDANHSRLQIALLLSVFSSFWLVWFLGFLRWLYEGAERATRGFVRAAPIAFGGGIAGVAAAAAAGTAQLTAVELNGSVAPSITRALDLFHTYGLTWAAMLLSVFLLSSFFIVQVTEILPAWLGMVAGAGAVVGFIQAVLVLAPGQDGGVFGVIGIVWFALFAIYVLGTSIHLARRAETALLAG